MAYKDKEKEKQYKKAYHLKWYAKNKQRKARINKVWYKKARLVVLKKYAERNNTLRMKVLYTYGGNPPKCACCGEDELVFLTIDHCMGGGYKDRKHRSMYSIFTRILKEMDFSKYQILCMNCNWAKNRYKIICPHQQKEARKNVWEKERTGNSSASSSVRIKT